MSEYISWSRVRRILKYKGSLIIALQAKCMLKEHIKKHERGLQEDE